MLVLLPLLLCAVLPGVWSVEPGPTYNYRDFSTGRSFNCTMCPPGTHMTGHCTTTSPTVCSPCEEAHYTARWNYLPRCLYCNNLCFGNLEVETECSPVNNRVCRCKPGFYMSQGRCVTHRKCKPGTGVETKGTPQANTVCKRCSEGYFSNSSSAKDSCVKHQQCTSGELLPGSVYHDTVCGSCEEFNKSGDIFRTFVSGLFTSHFTSHKVRLTKMNRIVNRHFNKSARRRRIKSAVRGSLRLQHHSSWMPRDPEQLKLFLQMLRTSELRQLAGDLEMSLNELQEQLPNCNLFLSIT